jgi:hypothetical protein
MTSFDPAIFCFIPCESEGSHSSWSPAMMSVEIMDRWQAIRVLHGFQIAVDHELTI